MTKDQLIKESLNFLENVFFELKNNNLIFPNEWQIDHLCYRTETVKEYNFLKIKLSEFSKFLIESMVNGRLISSFKLDKPLVFKHHKIDLIELPSPKAGQFYDSGFEHFEYVIDQEFKTVMSHYPKVQFDTSNMRSKINPDISFKISKYKVKLHHEPLEAIIKEELKLI